MRQQMRWMVTILAVLTALVATVFSAYATGPASGNDGPALAPAAGDPGSRLAACTRMRPSEVVWVTLDADGEIVDEVEQYDSGTSVITPVFQYNCVPKKTTIVTVFYFGGDAVYSDKQSLKTSNNKGFYPYPLATLDGAPLNDGEWGVEFYNNKTLLTAGTVMIGEAGADPNAEGNTAAVEGTVTDKRTRKPIEAAVILVLAPGNTVQDWLDAGQPDDQVYTAGKSDSRGTFRLENPVERGQTYSMLIVARSYKTLGTDNFRVGADTPAPVVVTIQMSK